MQGFAVVLAVILGLSLTTTKVVDFVRNLPYFKNADGSPKFAGSAIWNVLAFVVGVLLCVGWQHSFVNDLFAQVPALSNVHLDGNAGYLLSGLIVGAGAGFFHELLDALSSIANRNNASLTE